MSSPRWNVHFQQALGKRETTIGTNWTGSGTAWQKGALESVLRGLTVKRVWLVGNAHSNGHPTSWQPVGM